MSTINDFVRISESVRKLVEPAKQQMLIAQSMANTMQPTAKIIAQKKAELEAIQATTKGIATRHRSAFDSMQQTANIIAEKKAEPEGRAESKQGAKGLEHAKTGTRRGGEQAQGLAKAKPNTWCNPRGMRGGRQTS